MGELCLKYPGLYIAVKSAIRERFLGSKTERWLEFKTFGDEHHVSGNPPYSDFRARSRVLFRRKRKTACSLNSFDTNSLSSIPSYNRQIYVEEGSVKYKNKQTNKDKIKIKPKANDKFSMTRIKSLTPIDPPPPLPHLKSGRILPITTLDTVYGSA